MGKSIGVHFFDSQCSTSQRTCYSFISKQTTRSCTCMCAPTQPRPRPSTPILAVCPTSPTGFSRMQCCSIRLREQFVRYPCPACEGRNNCWRRSGRHLDIVWWCGQADWESNFTCTSLKSYTTVAITPGLCEILDYCWVSRLLARG
jgi:hypothetical protein